MRKLLANLLEECFVLVSPEPLSLFFLGLALLWEPTIIHQLADIAASELNILFFGLLLGHE